MKYLLSSAVPILDEDIAKIIHYFTVSLTKDCSGSDSFDSIRYQSMIYAWAPGDEGMVLPNNVGFPMLHNENHQAVDIEIHYHNPFLISGMKDSIGIRFYYTNDERTHWAGTLIIGYPWMMLYGTQINDSLTKYLSHALENARRHSFLKKVLHKREMSEVKMLPFVRE